MKPLLILLSLVFVISACESTPSTDRLERISYVSELGGPERDYYVYLPAGYDSEPDKEWPVLMFLHGNGERGNAKEDLPFTMVHGPLLEAWAQKKALPFILIVPQLHMFGLDTVGIDYLTNRDVSKVPQRLEVGTPDRESDFGTPYPMNAEAPVTEFSETLPLSEFGWDRVQNDLLGMVDHVLGNYNSDSQRVYLSGLSYGGFGTWYMGSHYPDRFAAINPVVGWGHPSLMPTIAEQNLPVWVFAGGRDYTVNKKYFYKGVNLLEELGHTEVLFTIHEDMSHDAWRRIYAGDDIYNWLLEHRIN